MELGNVVMRARTPLIVVVAATTSVSYLLSPLRAVKAQQSFSVDDIPGKENAIRYPGTTKQTMIDVLGHLKNRFQEAAAPLENIRAIGQMSQITAKWNAGTADLTSDSMPLPQWRDFTLVIKDGKKRFEFDYGQPPSDGALPMRVYRLFDGESFYRLDGDALMISGAMEPDMHWLMNFAFEFYKCKLVRFRTTWCPVPDYLHNLIDLVDAKRDLRNGKAYFEWTGGRLSCWRDQGLIIVKFVDDSTGARRQTVWLDSTRGYAMVRERVNRGHRQSGLFIREERDVEYSEIAPAVYFPIRAKIFTATLGKGPESDGGAGWIKTDIKIDHVDFGDFQVDPEFFDPDSLPIPVGANVSDRRGDRDVSFVYGRPPISEQLLEQALAQKPNGSRGWRTWLIVGNLVVCALLILLIVRRVISTT